MKYARVRLTPGEETIHPLFTLMTTPDLVSFAQMVDWNIGDTTHPILLFAVEGDHDRIASELDALSHISDFEFIPIDPTRFYLRVSPTPTSLTGKLLDMYTRGSFVIIHPVVYENGAAHVSLLGESADLQEAIRRFSSGLNVVIEQVSDFLPRPDSVISRLSARQREALEVALELGYYNSPRAATHAEIGEQMGCAANTVSVHLQKAEARVISSVLSYCSN